MPSYGDSELIFQVNNERLMPRNESRTSKYKKSFIFFLPNFSVNISMRQNKQAIARPTSNLALRDAALVCFPQVSLGRNQIGLAIVLRLLQLVEVDIDIH